MNRLLPGQFQARPAPEPEEMAQLKASLAKRIPKLIEQIGRSATAGERLSSTRDSRLSRECRRVLEHAAKEADRLQHQKISTGHLLLAFLREDVELETPILTDTLNEKGVGLDAAYEEITRFLSEGGL